MLKYILLFFNETWIKYATAEQEAISLLEWIIKEINRSSMSRKENLLVKAVLPGYPKIIMVTATPKQAARDFGGKSKLRRCNLNRTMDTLSE